MGCIESVERKYWSTCAISDQWMKLKLIRKAEYNDNTRLFTFGTPMKQPLGLPVCSSLRIRGGYGAESDEKAVRPYTPIFQNNKGEFTLLMKIYPGGKVSEWMDSLEIGSKVQFAHREADLKLSYPFSDSGSKQIRRSSITMLAVGTGITPMYQAMEAIMDNEDDFTEVVLLYGNHSVEDILLKDELEDMVERSEGRFKVVHIVGSRNTESIEGWDGEVGWVDQERIMKYAFPSKEVTKVFVCGIDALYETMCGPRKVNGVPDYTVKKGTVLYDLGYTDGQVYKF